MQNFVLKKVASKALDRPYDAACFQIERMPFRDEGTVANISSGPHGAIGLFLLERSVKAVNAGVAVYPKRVGDVLHGALIGEDQDRWSGDLREHVTHDGFHAWCEPNLTSFLRRAVTGRIGWGISVAETFGSTKGHPGESAAVSDCEEWA